MDNETIIVAHKIKIFAMDMKIEGIQMKGPSGHVSSVAPDDPEHMCNQS